MIYCGYCMNVILNDTGEIIEKPGRRKGSIRRFRESECPKCGTKFYIEMEPRKVI